MFFLDQYNKNLKNYGKAKKKWLKVKEAPKENCGSHRTKWRKSLQQNYPDHYESFLKKGALRKKSK